jgi:hypothetical protein
MVIESRITGSTKSDVSDYGRWLRNIVEVMICPVSISLPFISQDFLQFARNCLQATCIKPEQQTAGSPIAIKCSN